MIRFVRTGGVAVAALAASLALTACGSDDDVPKSSGPDAGSSATPGGDPGDQGPGGAGVDAAALHGTWTGLTDGKYVTVTITSGKVALVAERAVCQGDVKNTGEVTLVLECTGGSTDRTTGTIVSHDDKKLVLSWEGGTKDTLTKTVDAGKLPTDLPSPPDMPDLPDLPELPELPEAPEVPSSS
ncbi:hypothetical protein [Streptomyces sp. NPDC007346]|uniref:hypothetical protein n=1 Tax=Streptomyces sp. NPDC007346 TaxID=3154682 RepID=UPI003453FAE0